MSNKRNVWTKVLAIVLVILFLSGAITLTISFFVELIFGGGNSANTAAIVNSIISL